MKHKRKGLSLARKRDLKGYIFVLPFILGLALFFVQPMARSLSYAFGKVRLDPVLGAVTTPAGWANFTKIFDSNQYSQDLLYGFGDMLVDLPIIMIFSIFVALLLNKQFKGRAFARAVFFLPVLIASGIFVPGMITESTGGVQAMINKSVSQEMISAGASASNALRQLLGNIQFDQELIFYIQMAIDQIYSVINYSGLQILLYLAALHQVSDELRQAAHIDGASGWEFYWKVSLPLTSPYLSVMVVYTVVDAFFRRNSGHVSRLSNINPLGFLKRIEWMTFEMGKYTEAAALSWLYFALAFVFLMLVIWFMSRVTFYDG